MLYSREFELDLVSYCLYKPLYLKQHRERLAKLKFQDKFINLTYQSVFKCLNAYEMVPTESELKKLLAESMSEHEKFNQLEIDSVQDIVTDVYSRNVTSITGMSISNYLIEEEAKALSEELGTHKAETLVKQLKDYEHRINKLNYFFTEDEDLGLNFFSDEGILKAKALLEAYNNEDCISTGYPIWDKQLQGGFRKGELCVIVATTCTGKAQPLDAKILTPNGWTTMGKIKIGDKVFDWGGNQVNVTGVFPQGIKKVYKISFTDGTSAESCDEHLWWVRHFSSGNKGYKVLPLKTFKEDLKGTYSNRKERNNYQMPLCEPMKFSTKSFPIDPYVLGAMLGDGCLKEGSISYTCAEPELIELIRSRLPKEVVLNKHNGSRGIGYGFSKPGKKDPRTRNIFVETLNSWGLTAHSSSEKFIPKEYFLGDINQRLDLLQGLMDTDGHSEENNTGIDYCCASIALIEGVEFLVRSLGGSAHRGKTRVIDGKNYYRTYFNMPLCPFKLTRKVQNWKIREIRPAKKVVDHVEYIRDTQCQCIMVDSETSSYITDDFIVTHNTSMLLNCAVNLVKQDLRVVYLVLDNIASEMVSRSVGCLMDRDISVKLDPGAALDDVSDRFKEQFKNNFWLKNFAPRELNKSKLERYLARLKTYLYEVDKFRGVAEEKCGVIDVVIIDYIDLMLAESGAGEFWISAEHLAQEIKAVLKNNNILGLTATQGGTQAMQADTLKLYMAAGAKSRFNAPDLVFGMSQNEDEKMAKPASKFRLGCLKARRAQVNYEIGFQFWKEKQVIREDPAFSDVLHHVGRSVQPTDLNGNLLEKRVEYAFKPAISSITTNLEGMDLGEKKEKSLFPNGSEYGYNSEGNPIPDL